MIEQQQSSGFFGWLQSHPMLILIIAGVAVFGALFLKQKQTSTAASTAATTGTVDTSGLTTDSNGNPIIYRDTADTFINKVSGSYNNTSTTTSTEQYPVEPTTPTSHVAYVRGRYSNPQVTTYDKNNPGGVPVRATPDGTIVRLQAYGSQIMITGTAVTGKSNLSTTASGVVSTGSGSWLPVSGGYISAYDITGLS